LAFKKMFAILSFSIMQNSLLPDVVPGLIYHMQLIADNG
jgi:hypothetical protein